MGDRGGELAQHRYSGGVSNIGLELRQHILRLDSITHVNQRYEAYMFLSGNRRECHEKEHVNHGAVAGGEARERLVAFFTRVASDHDFTKGLRALSPVTGHGTDNVRR